MLILLSSFLSERGLFLLRYDLCSIEFTHHKCASRWFSVNLQSCAVITTIQFKNISEHFHHPKPKCSLVPICSQSLPPYPAPGKHCYVFCHHRLASSDILHEWTHTRILLSIMFLTFIYAAGSVLCSFLSSSVSIVHTPHFVRLVTSKWTLGLF